MARRRTGAGSASRTSDASSARAIWAVVTDRAAIAAEDLDAFKAVLALKQSSLIS